MWTSLEQKFPVFVGYVNPQAFRAFCVVTFQVCVRFTNVFAFFA